MVELLSASDLPSAFVYPGLFVRVVEQGLIDLEPWSILQGDELRRRAEGVRSRYPDRILVPFARRTDRDDVACFDLDVGAGPVAVIEDFEAVGFEQHERYDDFAGWLRSAVDDMIEFDD